MSRLLGDKRSGKLECTLEEAEDYIHKTYSDPSRDTDLPLNEKLLNPEPPAVEFDTSEPRLKEVQDCIAHARAASAPGQNGVPYKVYKNCPKLVHRLWKLSKLEKTDCVQLG